MGFVFQSYSNNMSIITPINPTYKLEPSAPPDYNPPPPLPTSGQPMPHQGPPPETTQMQPSYGRPEQWKQTYEMGDLQPPFAQANPVVVNVFNACPTVTSTGTQATMKAAGGYGQQVMLSCFVTCCCCNCLFGLVAFMLASKYSTALSMWSAAGSEILHTEIPHCR